MSVDRFVTATAAVEPDERLRLLERLDLYGLERCVEGVLAGQTTASQLTTALRRGSGIEQLRRVLDETFARNADALKASWALAALDRLSYEHPSRPWAAALRNEIEDVRLDPAMHRLVEIRAVQEWAAGAVTLPADLARALHRLVTGYGLYTRLGLTEDSTPQQLQEAAAAAARSWREFGNDPRANPNQRWLADVACRSCELAWSEAISPPKR